MSFFPSGTSYIEDVHVCILVKNYGMKELFFLPINIYLLDKDDYCMYVEMWRPHPLRLLSGNYIWLPYMSVTISTKKNTENQLRTANNIKKSL